MPEQPTSTAAPLLRLGVAAAVAAILAVRIRHTLALPQFWAEDGAVFYANAMIDLSRHGAGFVLTPYAGYLHLIPRLIACLSTYLPVVSVPAFYAWASIAVAAFVAWRIQSPRIALGGKWVAALAIAAVPHTGECFGAICDVQWITALWLLAILLSSDGKNKPMELSDVFGVFLVGLTGPFVLLFMPLFALRIWQRRSRQSVLLFLATIATGLVQLSMLMSTERENGGGSGPLAPVHLVAVLSRRLLISTFFGRLSVPPVVAALLGAAALGAGIWALIRARARLPGALELAAAAALVVGVSMYKLRLDLLLTYDNLHDGDRYFYTAKVILVWLIAAGAFVAPKPWRVGLLALFVIGLAANAGGFVYPAAEDLHWPEYAAKIQKGERVVAPILPKGLSLYYPGRVSGP